MISEKHISELRDDALSIFHTGLKAVDPKTAVRRTVSLEGDALRIGSQCYALSDFDNIHAVGAGKASAAMVQALEDLLRDRLTDGIVNVKVGHGAAVNKVRIVEAAHPVPDDAGLQGTREIIQLLEKTSDRDLVICMLSGGGSALLPCPAPGITLADKQGVTQLLLECGANIHEINAIRKHISAVKGGRLAQLAYPSKLVSLILSDVIGDDLDSIASGPTVPDRSTFRDCMEILQKYTLMEDIPEAVRRTLEDGIEGRIAETPKAGDAVFTSTQNEIIGSNILAVRAAARKARELGYNPLTLSTMIEGETKEVAKVHSAIAKEVLKTGNPVARPACIISGGETTVTIKGNGLGGRNQEFALAAALEIAELDGVAILSGGTDGTDGPTDAAGAVVDGETVRRAEQLGISATEFLNRNDSYRFFERLGDLIITGPTLTNVMDLRLILVA
jgi:hydroxypyruvate reductase